MSYERGSRSLTKSQRILHIELLLFDHPKGLTRSEIARRMGVHKSTIGRDIEIISLDAPLKEKSDGRLILERKDYLSAVYLNLFELEALHLSARLFARAMKFPFPHAAGALRKLAEAQNKVSPILASRIRATAEDIDDLSKVVRVDSAGYRRTIEQLGLAISENRPITLTYFSQNRNTEKHYRVFPITLEPHFEGRSVYLLSRLLSVTGEQKNKELKDLLVREGNGLQVLVGKGTAQKNRNNMVSGSHRDSMGKDRSILEAGEFRTLNVAHIRSVDLEEPRPDLNQDLHLEDLRTRLSHAWSVWTSDFPSVRVVLRFSSQVASRVTETLWHRSQLLEPQPDGSLVWQAHIAEPREMYPWIRGWGPEVEVIEPDWLREQHREDFLKGVGMYGAGM